MMDVLLAVGLIISGVFFMASMCCLAIGAYLLHRAKGTMKP